MNKPQLITLLVSLAVAIVAVGFLVWYDGEPPAGVEPRSPVMAGDEGVDPVEQVAADLTFEDGSFDELQSEAMPRTEVLTDEPDRPLVIQVWDGEAGVSAADAFVFVVDGFESSELTDPFAQHWSEVAETKGVRFKTDASGQVRLPPVQQWAMVTARLPGMYGFAKVGRDHREVETITLRPDETVTVRVVDGEGRTVAGVPVGVIQRIPERVNLEKLAAEVKKFEGQMVRVQAWIEQNPDQRQRAEPKIEYMRERIDGARTKLGAAEQAAEKEGPQATKNDLSLVSRTELRAQRKTDDEGLAVFRHFQIHRREREEWWPEERADRFEAVLLMPLQRSETVAFSGRPVPEATLELRMPPTGSIALRTVDRDGRPFTHPVHGELRVHGAEMLPWSRVRIRKGQGEESIVFPFVGLGLQFTASCRLDDGDFRWSAPQFAGPGSPGEQVVVDLAVAPGDGMLFGRVVGATGEPLRERRLTFLINGQAGRLEGETVVLDGEARFHLPYKVRQHRGPFRLEIRREDVRPVQGLATTLAGLPESHVTDLGDLRIDALGAIARGTVVDDEGEVVANARIQLQRERLLGDDSPRLEFVDEAFTEARTDPEGRFDLFGDLESGNYRLRAQAKEHFPTETAALQRDRSVTIVLQRRSRVVGTVRRPDWLGTDRVRAQLVSVADPEQQRDERIRDYRGDSYVYFDWVRPGVYDLSLRVRGYPDPFLQVDRIEILPGQQGVHPRLRDLDLGAFLHRFEILAVDENGRPCQPDRPLLAQVVRPDGSTGFVGFHWEKGRIELLSGSPHTEVVPLATGYRSPRTVLGQGRHELVFRRVPPVELHVPGMRDLVGATPVRMVMQLLGESGFPDQLEKSDGYSGRIAGWYAKSRFVSGLLRARDSISIQLMVDGRYRVLGFLGERKGSRGVAIRFGDFDVTAVPGGPPTQIVVDVDPTVVQQALTELAQRDAGTGTGGR